MTKLLITKFTNTFLSTFSSDREVVERLFTKREDLPTLPEAFLNDILKNCRTVVDGFEIKVQY